ncbi:tRNA (uracil-O(2)-)-methyltransferase [[Candida] railenensis]|uniref:tRNA (uracil-O(2)-)-methyltransferase n=1 Tax=[Candida] railenensis TaxID=45579 RepID=A0A9P0W1F2_9ASCO|nr:tRNA (uracil-O(2)-)-methyltransferase [[Candida] railenensis]
MKSSDKEPELLSQGKSILGEPWVPIYEAPVEFDGKNFQTAMTNLIRQPNINSTVIMRADILSEIAYTSEGEVDSQSVSELAQKMPEFEQNEGGESVLHRYLEDVALKSITIDDSTVKLQKRADVVRRIIPRNPFKDHIINQTCLLLTGDEDESVLVVYIPHIKTSDEIPFYLPPVYAVGILLHDSKLSIHYFPFKDENADDLRSLDSSSRPIRIALRLLQTSTKHSQGAKDGYEKRVNHDLVVPKELFQNRYISLKKKYSSTLVNSWVESTDPKKHVFEDLAIAAFLIELWAKHYKGGASTFEFRDLGCGNGLLVYILNMEGYRGKGIDARARKSWLTYPKHIQANLLEQVIIPQILLKPHPAVAKLAPHQTDNGRLFMVPEQPSTATNKVPLVSYYSSTNLLESTQVCTTKDFAPNTFIIGNHSDELTCWIPLLGFPFLVIPCCSHALSGAKYRYSARKQQQQHPQPHNPQSKSAPASSTYGSLVDHVEDIAFQMGWKVEREMLRIPSTRNAAVIGISKEYEESQEAWDTRVLDVVALEGGAEGWVGNTMALMKKSPRNH